MSETIIREFIYRVELESDGRWIAEIPSMPGIMQYGKNVEEAISRCASIAYDRLNMRVNQNSEAGER